MIGIEETDDEVFVGPTSPRTTLAGCVEAVIEVHIAPVESDNLRGTRPHLTSKHYDQLRLRVVLASRPKVVQILSEGGYAERVNSVAAQPGALQWHAQMNSNYSMPAS